jgi:hypothetical protein
MWLTIVEASMSLEDYNVQPNYGYSISASPLAPFPLLHTRHKGLIFRHECIPSRKVGILFLHLNFCFPRQIA